ncbi:MAG: substrate-binding domain-containing protein [Fibromonadaceae bacterium]|nr:substrate-binding domain-containing protein [Fibromonadaceae bacterium]
MATNYTTNCQNLDSLDSRISMIMRKCMRNPINLLIMLIMVQAISCSSDGGTGNDDTPSSSSEEPFAFTMENYPRIDGSTSTNPLNYIIAAKLLDLEYAWPSTMGIRDIVFLNQNQLPLDFREKLKCSQTHNAIINLIDNKTDLIIVARKMSEDEKQHAENTGASLIETPIAIDALDFIINAQNPVNSLSVKQIQDIYLGDITNWNEVGGADYEIKPFIRNANSGSQEMMNEIVMSNTGMPDWDEWLSEEEFTIGSMIHVYQMLINNPNQGICFTPHYYKEYMVEDFMTSGRIKTLAINGIAPDENSIKNKSYPFVANVYASIRSDLDQNSSAYKLYQWLQTSSGKLAIEESGYVAN